MAGWKHVRVSSLQSELAIAPGARSDLTVEVVNTGSVIDGVSARIVGLPDRAVTARPAMLPLFPDAAGEITLTVDLPPTFPAGTHPMTIEVASRQPNTGPEYVNVDLTVPLAPAVALTSRPEVVRARRTGRFIVTVSNRGNALLDVELTVTDPQKHCSVTVQPATLSLRAGQSVECVVTVRGRRILMGTDSDRSLVAEVTARAVDTGGDSGPLPETPAAEPLTEYIPITFRQRPYVTRGMLTALILLAIIALWASAFLFGLDKVFAGDPLTKSAPASFFAATPEGGAADTGSGGAGSGGAGSAGSGEAGAGGAGSAEAGAGTGSGAAGPGGGAAAPAGALPKTGTLPPGVGGAIGGTVTAASSGDGVGRILVTALRVKADGSTVAVSSAATQADGTYQVAGLFPGQYLLRFEAPGFRTTYFPTATTAAEARQLTATSGQVTRGGDAVVIGLPATITGKVDFGDVTEPVTSTISARLLSAGGAPAPRQIPEVKTGADGAYTLSGLPAPGSYLLTVTTEGYETTTVQTTVGGGAHRFVSTAVLSAGTTQISGTVTDGSAPLGGATVSLTVDGQQISTGTPTVGQVGHFVIDHLPTPATYIITVSKDGYGQVSQVIDLTPGSTPQDLTIALAVGTGLVQGTVVDATGAGVGGATVTVGGLADAPSTATLTNGQVGAFRLESLPVPGSYTLTVTAPGFAEQTVPVILTADAPLPPVSIVMAAATGTITGTVTGPGGAGLAGVAVTATDGQHLWPVVTTSAAGGSPAGSFTIAGLPAGRFTVTAAHTGADGTVSSQTTLVTVKPGKTKSVAFQLTAGG